MNIELTQIDEEAYETDQGDLIEYNSLHKSWEITLHPAAQTPPDYTRIASLEDARRVINDHYETFGARF